MTNITNILREYFPQWMAIRKNDASIGAQFLEAFGLQLTDIQDYLEEMLNNSFIGTANIGEIDILYKTYVQPAVITDEGLVVTDDLKNPIPGFTRLDKFYKAQGNGFIIDTEKCMLYIRKPYRETDTGREYFHSVRRNNQDYYRIYVQGIEHYVEIHHVWNVFDEFGMLLGVERMLGENNAKFKDRILDVFKNQPGHTPQGIVNHISRMLGIKREEVTVMPLAKLAEQEIGIHGNVSARFASYVDKLNKLIPFTWDTMRWDESYWDMFDKIGLDYLPHIYNPDMSMWKDEEFQAGIGDNADLYITAPTKEAPAKDFTYRIGLTGTIDRTEDVYVEHELQYRVHAEGQKVQGNTQPKTIYHTVVASEEVPFDYDVKAYKLYERIHAEGFDGSELGPYVTNNVEIVPGNTIMSSSGTLAEPNHHLRVRFKLSTKDRTKTPTLKSITIKWIDVNDDEQSLVLNTSEGFTRNDADGVYPKVNTDLASVETTGSNTLVLGKGSYSRYYDTMNSWQDGIRQNAKPTRAGLVMVLPQERS
jgi:hypothetical protein